MSCGIRGKLAMTWFRLSTVLSRFASCIAANSATAGILVENHSTVTLLVYLQGAKDTNYRGPYSVPPRGKVEIPAPSGKYSVVARRPDGTEHHLGWQDYSDSRRTFNVSLVR